MHIYVFIQTNTSEEDVFLLQNNFTLNICKNIQPLFLDQHLITKYAILRLQMPLYLLQGRTDFFTNEILYKQLPIASNYMVTLHKHDTLSEVLGIKKNN